MATRTRGGAASTSTPAKEKRGASPSNTTRKITPSPSTKTNSPAKNHGPTSSGKNVPHYLKSTASSGPDVKPQLGEKPVVEASSSKATLNRRRSLDKPQPPPQTQRLRVPPNASLRSSSFSGKSSVSSQHQKTGADKGVMRGTKDGAGKQQQQHGLYARSSSSNVKKSTTAVYVKKQVSTSSGGGSSMKKEEVVISPVEKIEDHAEQVLSDHDAEAEVEQDHVHEALTAEKVEDGNNEVGDLENEKTMIAADDHRTEVSDQSDDKDAKIVEAESSAVVEHKHDNDHDEHVAVKNEEEAEEKSHVEEVVITTNQEDAKEEIIDEVRNDEIVAGDDNLIENVVEAKNEKDKEEEESIEAGNVSDAHEAAKETIVKEVVIEKKPETINLTAKYPGKKDVAVSNDVIEETASKLREQRKNKVKALAGAFETVISLQEPK